MEKVNKNMYHISSIKSENQELGSFLDVSRCSHAIQRQGNVQESLLFSVKYLSGEANFA